jgi:hypothetical protein
MRLGPTETDRLGNSCRDPTGSVESDIQDASDNRDDTRTSKENFVSPGV